MNWKRLGPTSRLFFLVLFSLFGNSKLNAAPLDEAGSVHLWSMFSLQDISVCWEFSGFEEEKAWVQQVIEREYVSTQFLILTGWKNCRELPNALVRIAEFDQEPHTLAIGGDLAKVLHGVVLNFTFENVYTSCLEDRKACIEGIAVHEFGHVAGLPDIAVAMPGEICLEPAPPLQKMTARLLEADSVMNACNPNWRSSFLSPSDKVALSEMSLRGSL